MKSIPPELINKIDEIRSWMFEGDQKRVANKSGKDEPYVSRVLNKKVMPNKKVLDAGIEVMNENKARFEIKPSMKVA